MKDSEMTGKLHLDPRTKLLLLFAFSIIVMIDITDGPAYIIQVIMTFVPVVLVVAEGKHHIGIRFVILYVIADLLMKINSAFLGGTIGMLILFLPQLSCSLLR